MTLIGGAAAWPLAARAQQPAMPVIGHLAVGSPNKPFIAALHQGLKEGGYVEGQSVAFEYRFANGQFDRLPALAADLVGRGVAVIFTEGGSPAALAAKQATATIPIVFLGGGDPVQDGLVSSFNKPEANLTGVTLYSAALGPKKLELLRDLAPRSGVFGVLMSRTPAGETEANNVSVAAKAVKQDMHILGASSVDDIERAFDTFANEKVAALLVTTGAFFGTNTQRIVALAARYSLPAIYDRREFTAVGGLISYGASFVDVFRQAGIYVARILKGARPTDLPVLQPTKFELVINLKTAKTLGITVPLILQMTADEVIE
jgi:putative ABC transport system substrate-binding protein